MGPPKYKAAQYRYGREEMLGLFVPKTPVPEQLHNFQMICVEKAQHPLAFAPPSEEEQVFFHPTCIMIKYRQFTNFYDYEAFYGTKIYNWYLDCSVYQHKVSTVRWSCGWWVAVECHVGVGRWTVGEAGVVVEARVPTTPASTMTVSVGVASLCAQTAGTTGDAWIKYVTGSSK